MRDTSHKAYESVKHTFSTTESKILLAIEMKSFLKPDSGGYIDEELEMMWPKERPTSIRSARAKLYRKGYVEDSGHRRATSRGRDAIVWRPSENYKNQNWKRPKTNADRLLLLEYLATELENKNGFIMPKPLARRIRREILS